MEIASFLTLRCYNHTYHHQLRYLHSSYSRRTFMQRSRRIHQRLIPLTEEIRKTMTDFNVNASQSNTSISDKQLYNTISITSLVRGEVQDILQELSISDQFIRKDDIDDLIEKCLKQKVTIIQENGDLSNDDVEIIVQMCDEVDRNKLIVENLRMLEDRVKKLEELRRYEIQGIRNLKYLQTDNFKSNKEQRQSAVEKMDLQSSIHPAEMLSSPAEITPEEQPKENTPNVYDELYYMRREYFLNLLNYKKSLPTLQLNKKSQINPYAKPINLTIPESRQKPKQFPTFIVNNK